MAHFEFIWLDHNIQHLADNGLAPDDAENATRKPTAKFKSDSSGERGIKGYSTDGRPIAVINDQIDELTVKVITGHSITRE